MQFIDFKDRVPDRKKNDNYKVRHEDGTETIQYWNGRGFINFGTVTWNYFSDIIGWYDPTPASAEQEAARLYPAVSTLEKSQLPIYQIQRQAHISCAGMYTGEIEKLRAELNELKTKNYGQKHNL